MIILEFFIVLCVTAFVAALLAGLFGAIFGEKIFVPIYIGIVGIVLVLWIGKKIIDALGGIAVLFNIISMVLVPLLCVGILMCLVVIFARLKRRSYLKRLVLCGVGSKKDIQCSEKVWRKLIKKGFVSELSPAYIISNQFRDGIVEDINQRPVRSAAELQEIFFRNAPNYQASYNEVLLAELTNRNCLLEFFNGGSDRHYLSGAFVEECEHLINVEGAATKTEFADLCNKSCQTACLNINSGQLADIVLEHMVTTAKVDVCPPVDSHEILYVSKHLDPHTKMKKVEITL